MVVVVVVAVVSAVPVPARNIDAVVLSLVIVANRVQLIN